MMLSKYLSLADAAKSETAIRKGIDNTVPPGLIGNAKYIAENVFDPIKDKFPNAGCYSFYRGVTLNREVGGSANSFHCFAGALDIDTPGNVDNKAIFKFVLEDNVPFNELIWEYGNLYRPEWVHVGLLPGYTTKNIIHIYNDQEGKKARNVLTKEKAFEIFGL